MNYYPHIDGLRAIAILLVLFFHGGLALFPSGFIGVDVFFVISGFLITSIIVDSLDKQKFFFAQFYSRRLWRLQPVFLCLLVITTLVSLAIYLPDDLVFFSKSLRKTALYLSNNFFSGATKGYFAPDGKEYALMHTWSLAIEWQCYLILPVIFYVLYRVFGKQKLAGIIYLLTALSLSLSFYYYYKGIPTAYYQLSSRLFEFLIGSCIVFINARSKPVVQQGLFGNVITALGLSILFYIAMKGTVSANFPNGYALLVCCITAMLIKVGIRENPGFVIRLLSNKMLVFVGLISYSLYIWHWPVFAFKHYMEFSDTVWITILSFMIVFVISYCSWRFIEKPVRHGGSIKPLYTLLLLFLVPVACIQLVAYTIKAQDGFPARFADSASVFAQLKKHNSAQRNACLVFKNTKVSDECTFGVRTTTNKTGFMIGDSFSNHYWRFMEYLAKRANLSIVAQATGSCLTLPGITQYAPSNSGRRYDECRQQTELYYNMIKNNHYDYVIIGESWNGYFGNVLVDASKKGLSSLPAKTQMETALDHALQLITEAGSRPILIKAIALSPKGDPYRCFLHHIKQKKRYDAKDCDYIIPPEQQTWINNVFATMEQKYPQLIVIDPQKVLCDADRCKADINNVPVFRDAAHLTDYASYELAKRYLKNYKNPLLG